MWIVRWVIITLIILALVGFLGLNQDELVDVRWRAHRILARGLCGLDDLQREHPTGLAAVLPSHGSPPGRCRGRPGCARST